MTIGKWVALAFSLMILGQAYLVRRHVGTWLFPACLFGLFWFGYTFLPLGILFWVPVEPYAVAFIFLCTLAFSFGSLPFGWKMAFDKNAEKRETATLVYGTRFLRIVFYVSTLLSVVFIFLNLFDQGFSLRDLFFDLYASAAAYANLRFSESLNANISERLGFVCAYLGAILGGFLFPCMPVKAGRRLILVLSFVPPILIALTQSAKWHLFLCIVFFYAGLLVYRASAGTPHLLKRGTVKWIALCMAIVLVVVTMAFLGRGLYATEDNEALLSQLGSYYASYAFAHIYAFSDWFGFTTGGHSQFSYPPENTTWGFYTFAALFRVMGSDKVLPPGMFDEYYSYGNLLNGNIYTMFRGLILDFGFVGSLLFMLVTSFLFHSSFRAMLHNKEPVFSVAVFVMMMGYFYTSFIASMLGSNRIYYVTFVLLWIVLHINKRMTQRAAHQLAPAHLTEGVRA